MPQRADSNNTLSQPCDRDGISPANHGIPHGDSDLPHCVLTPLCSRYLWRVRRLWLTTTELSRYPAGREFLHEFIFTHFSSP